MIGCMKYKMQYLNDPPKMVHRSTEKGFGYVLDEYGDKRKVELHWYQNPVNGKVEMKIKRQPGGEIYIDED